MKWTVFIKYLLNKLSVHLQSSQCFVLHIGTLIMLLITLRVQSCSLFARSLFLPCLAFFFILNSVFFFSKQSMSAFKLLCKLMFFKKFKFSF